MVQFVPLDPKFPVFQQLDIPQSPVILVNVFTVGAADVDELLRVWQDDAAFMKRQPGFISTQLHRAIGESYMFMNEAVWESTDHFRAAFNHPEFKEKASLYPESAVASPHLFKRVAVAGICVA
jgi:heme-degrading monooxygenase HmoA